MTFNIGNDIEMGNVASATDPAILQTPKKNCWGWTFRDWTQVPTCTGALISVSGAVFTWYEGTVTGNAAWYVPAVLLSYVTLSEVIAFGRIWCLADLKSLGEQNSKLAERINVLQGQIITLTQDDQKMSSTVDQLQKEREDVQVLEKSIETTLQDKINEIDKLHQSLAVTEQKMGELETIDISFQNIEQELKNQIGAAQKEKSQISLAETNLNNENNVAKDKQKVLRSDVDQMTNINVKLTAQIDRFEKLSNLMKAELSTLSDLLQRIRTEKTELLAKESELDQKNEQALKYAQKIKAADDRLIQLNTRLSEKLTSLGNIKQNHT